MNNNVRAVFLSVIFFLCFLRSSNTSKTSLHSSNPHIPVQVFIPNNIIQQPNAGSNSINVTVMIENIKNMIMPYITMKNMCVCALVFLYVMMYRYYARLYDEVIHDELYCVIEYDEGDNYKNIIMVMDSKTLHDHVKKIAVLCSKTKQLLAKQIFFIFFPYILFGSFSYKTIKKNHEKLKKLLLTGLNKETIS